MTPPERSPTPEPPIDRPTRMRWGCMGAIFLGGVLVGGSLLSIFNAARFRESLPAAGLQATGIFKAMMLYAQDHDGKFPHAETNSNQAFRQLFPDYMEGERSFFVPHSAWHDPAPGQRPDDDIGFAPGYAKCLERGENHWAYVAGLDSKSSLFPPIVADGFVENQPGTYTDDPTKRGGVWRGSKAHVVFIDGSQMAVQLSAGPHIRVLRMRTGQPIDIFTREGGLPEGARVLNPE